MKYKKSEWVGKLPEAVRASSCRSQVLRAIGLPTVGSYYHYSVQQEIDRLGLDTAHFNSKREMCKTLRRTTPLSPDELLVQEGDYSKRGSVRKLIIRDNLIPYKCAICMNNGTHMGRTLSLHLDHINGINNDHRLENLRWLCPNCHSQTPTWGAKRLKKLKVKSVGRPAARGPRPSKRKVERPSREHLQFLLTQYSFTELGRRYRVSDNAVRKWAKSYEIMPS
jgi:5-methylcytosine-specific restriction endonuclease McrA